MILTKKSRRFFYTVFQEVVILEIYPDVIFLENFLMDYILLMLTGKVLRRKKHPWGILAGAVLGGGYTVFFYMVPGMVAGKSESPLLFLLSVLNFFVLIAMVKFAFHPVRGKELLWCTLTCLGLTFVTVGVLEWLRGIVPLKETDSTHLGILLGSILFGCIFLKKLFSLLVDRDFSRACELPIAITIHGQKLHCMGLMDSGNSLYEPITRKPVVIVEEQVLQEHDIRMEESGFFAIPYHAIGTEKGIMKGVLADELEIQGEREERKWNRVMLGIYEGKVSQTQKYQVILHPKL